MSIDYKEVVPDAWKERLGWSDLAPSLRDMIGQFALEMYGLGRHAFGQIDDLKYDGRLVILDDGSRWEVDSADASTSQFWNLFDQVVVIAPALALVAACGSDRERQRRWRRRRSGGRLLAGGCPNLCV